ncbi:MAG: iron ABC transporter permease [Myxococcaceae bacterium]
MKRSIAWVALTAPLTAFALFPLARLLLGAELSTMFDERALLGLRGTLLSSAGASAIALMLGLPTALLIERCELPARPALRAMFTLPAALPPFIFAMGWVSLANPSAGWLNQLLGAKVFDIYGAGGIAFVLGVSGAPLVYLACRAALQRIDSSLEEAARICGAGPLRTLFTITAPLAMPAALSGAALVFLFAASAFGVPYLLGVTATPPTPTLTTLAYAQLLTGSRGLSQAGALAIWLLILATAVLALAEWLGRRARTAIPVGKGLALRPMSLGRWRTPAFAAACGVLAIAVVLPLGAVLLTSLQPSYGRFDGLTVKHWSAQLTHPRTLAAAGRSLVLAAGSGLVVMIAGLGYALLARTGAWVAKAPRLLSSWPYAVPGTVLALGLVLTFSRDVRFVIADQIALVLALANTLWLVGVAYVVKHLALGTRNAAEGLARADPTLAEAARISGATPFTAFLDATLPQLKSALAAAFTVTFLACATEMTMSVLLAPTGKDLLGTLLFETMSYADPNGASVLACAFVLFVGGGLAVQAWLTREAPR